MTSENAQTLSLPALERLAFWGKNVTVLGDVGRQWPGFAYTDAEWARLTVLASTVGGGAFAKFQLVTTVVFIALAAAGIGGVFLPLASALFPHPAETQPLPFVLLLAAAALLILGLGLPIAMQLAATVSTDGAMRAVLTSSAGDRALAGKVRFQIGRMIAIMCGLFVPGTLLWIAFNVQAGPIITALKWPSFAAIAISVAYTARSALK